MNLFLQAVLGEDAHAALSKAGERSQPLAAVIGPRTVLGWCNLASRWSYDGTVPGHDDSLLRFEKSEGGLTGIIAIGDRQLDFENAQPANLSAMLCVSLGCSPDLAKSEDATQRALARLGETIDLMVKARVVNLLKAETPRCKACNKCYGVKLDKCPRCSEELDKAELPGKAHGATAPEAPQTQDAPQAKAPSRMAVKKPTSLNMTKSQMETRCTVCEATQFSKSGEYRGCHCLRDLAKSTTTELKGDGCVVTFGDGWTKSHIRMLMEIVDA
jgi:hypothetical protein